MTNRNVVICIDDEEIILDSLAMEIEQVLPEIDLELLPDNSEAEALVSAIVGAGQQIAVIICDYIMPGRKGDEVLASLHRLAPNARTIMLTGQSSLEGVTNAINHANLYRYIAKPWSKDDFALTLRGALDSYEQEATIKRQNRELKEFNESLEQKVIDRTRALTAANDELAAAHRKIEEYLSIIDRHVLISRINKAGEVVYASEAFCRKSGFARHELIGKNYWHALFSSITERQMKEIVGCIEQGTTWTGEIRHQARDGNYYWVHEIVSPHFADESVIIGFTTIRQDITDKKAIEEISMTDSLTGLYNRRYFNQVMEMEIGRARRNVQLLALCMFDVDCFKAYNDNYGHVAGDWVLAQLGALLNDSFKRGGEYAFRVGGEEFALLFPVRNEAEASDIAVGLLRKIERLDLTHAHNSAAPCVTVSMGLRIIRPTERALTLETAYRDTDDLLYRAKNDGKNRLACDFSS